MKWIDYREKLGIGFDDKAKLNMLNNKIKIFINEFERTFEKDDYIRYAITVGEDISPLMAYLERSFQSADSIPCLISKCIALYNSFKDSTTDRSKVKKGFHDFLLRSLEDLNIQFEIVEDEDGVFIFPKGAKELDDALVSEPLEWLSAYPSAHKTFVIALKQYSDGIYIRDVADNLRKALEAFLQEFLGNKKNLESNKNEICKYLGEQGVDAGISGLFQPLISSYKNINDRIAKHNDAVDKKLLEFLLYQTGVLIRMVLSIKVEENQNAD